MSASGLKAELKFLASIFDKNHERFRIVSWKLDELHCQFLVPPPPPPPGSSLSPPPPLTLHCNITVRRRVVAPRGRAGADLGAAVPGQRAPARETPGVPGTAGWRLGPGPGRELGLPGREEVEARRSTARAGFALLAPRGPRRAPRSPWPPAAGLLWGPRLVRGLLSVAQVERLSSICFSYSFSHRVPKPTSLLVQPVLVCVLVSEDKRTLKAYVFKEKV